MVAGALHVCEHLVEWLRVGHELGRTHEISRPDDRDRFSRIQCRGEVFEVEDPEHVVGVLADHGYARMSGPQCEIQRLRDGLVVFDPDHLGARDHHLAGIGIAEVEDGLDHPALICRHHSACLREVDDLT